ncbi:Cof-type HAD-IIB family hydrolase [Mycoplasma sp. ES3157-GEN-MYC]|uniref:HAD family phosphatase n=1 Tax=Mycoplasma miroungigenitalium TaxID=754515 RepID=A0A6M4JF61_9MOLU|nr:HAD family hydrolase [Mycoplasma miroungigenitalium]MBU4690229.1 Cof-type HAD-IIB family hydrolase [Mycoplasma miroungigenitalium]MBU4691496.1 Cof-type HAD-IIB family hydrolase [Mycoplasma miroungigenitalium]QJR43331.1 HAD family phosphatase [Mycoplasma miroungigenitalium]
MTKSALRENIKLAAFDIDGTLLPYEQPEFSDTVSLMFTKLKESNIYSTLATAREFVTIGSLMDKAEDLDFFIGANGMFVYDLKSKKIIFEKTIAFKDLKTLYEELSSIPEYKGLTVTDLNYCYHTPGMNLDTWFLRPHNKKMKPMNWNIMDKNHLHIITIQTENQEGTDAVIEAINEIIEKHDMPLEINSSWHKGVFVCPKGVTKSHTIQWLANYLDLNNHNNVIAFGDSSNDYEMLKDAAYGVAMEDADEYLKLVARDVAKSVNVDGAYWKLKELNLIK